MSLKQVTEDFIKLFNERQAHCNNYEDMIQSIQVSEESPDIASVYKLFDELETILASLRETCRRIEEKEEQISYVYNENQEILEKLVGNAQNNQ